MSTRNTPADDKDPHSERRAFAKRLRELRVPRGYRTARSFAEKLGIDENRYTRYERAEVEPDIALLVRICRTLEIAPDELFGFGASVADGGFGEGRQRHIVTEDAAGSTGSTDGMYRNAGNGPDGATPLGRTAWELAEEVVALTEADASNGAGNALSRLAAVTTTYRRLLADPIGGIEGLTQNPAIVAAEEATQQRIASLARQLGLAASAAPPPPSGS